MAFAEPQSPVQVAPTYPYPIAPPKHPATTTPAYARKKAGRGGPGPVSNGCVGATDRHRRLPPVAGRTLEFMAAGAVLEHGGGLLLVCNRRRGGTLDWSTPGGVIDATDADVLAGLGREVEEETALRVTEWEGPLYRVTARSLDLGWVMRCEVHRAVVFEGDLLVDDPDGIVVDAGFYAADEVGEVLAECFRWVREPLEQWLTQRWVPADARHFRYDVRGTSLDALEVVHATER
ncbi:MAG: NUDIX hydrolase [Actinobacteria bacterium]|nr:NUDIX hydrolase [Actinomycetota bacterium]